MISGIINVHKPIGITSSDVVIKLRKILFRRDIGHLGTLDPNASGVLPIAVGRATKLFDFFLSKTKSYTATFRFGYTSNTLDTSGKVEFVGGEIPQDVQIALACQKLTGTYPQMPPRFSAKSVGGVRAYDLAREGVEFELQPKTVTVQKFDFIKDETKFEQYDRDYTFEIVCSSGTYIRSLARDLGEILGVSCIMSSLIRTRCGEWTIQESITLEKLSENGCRADDFISPIQNVLDNLFKLEIPIAYKKLMDNGVPIDLTKVDRREMRDFLRICDELVLKENYFTLYCDCVLYGLGIISDNKIRIDTYLKEQ